MKNVDVAALAKLARLELSAEESQKLEAEFPALLALVDAIAAADVSGVTEEKRLRNVMRDDTAPYDAGSFTEDLLAAAPRREGDRIAVRQVVSRKK